MWARSAEGLFVPGKGFLSYGSAETQVPVI